VVHLAEVMHCQDKIGSISNFGLRISDLGFLEDHVWLIANFGFGI
jgi:hypothetical protein